MEGPFSGRTAVVTGAGRGIGEAVARALAAGGARVAVVSRTPGNSQRVADEIQANHPGQAIAVAVDVADHAACLEAGRTVMAAFGDQIDILVNNAGITRDGLLLRMGEEAWDAVLGTNLKGAFNMVKACQKSLLRSPAGRIINIGSVIGLTGNAGQANYAAAKAGLIGLTKSLAREFAGRGVTANCIAPGFIETDMTAALGEDVREKIRGKIPLARFGQAEDVAAAVCYLAGDGGRYVTGQVLVVDGGMVM